MKQMHETPSYEAAAMRVVIQPLLDEELSYFDECNAIPHTYSQAFQDKLQKLFLRDHIRRGLQQTSIFCKRAVICFMIASSIMLLSCAAIKPLRERMTEVLLSWYEEYVSVDFQEDSESIIPRLLTYVPEGYTVSSDLHLDGYRIIRYMNDSGNTILFTRRPCTENEIFLDHEHHTVEPITIGETSGIYLAGESGYENMITWTSEGYNYSIVGMIDQNEIIKMAESVQ